MFVLAEVELGKNAFRLVRDGDLRIITLPKTIDNDIWGTDVSFGFDTAMSIACEAIDRLHTTASSHHRIMIVDVMGHNTGWLALESERNCRRRRMLFSYRKSLIKRKKSSKHLSPEEKKANVLVLLLLRKEQFLLIRKK